MVLLRHQIAKRVAYFVLLAVLTGFVLRSYSHKPVSSESHRKAQIQIFKIICSCPNWAKQDYCDSNHVASANPKKVAIARAIVSHLEMLQCYDTDDIYHAEVDYIRWISAEQPPKMETILERGMLSRLLLVNEIVFNIPSNYPSVPTPLVDNYLIKGSKGVDFNNWPLSILSNGDLRLTGCFSGYFGPDFDALKNFRYCVSHYSRRRPSAGCE